MTTIAILLGASRWEKYPGLDSRDYAPAYRKAAERVIAYLTSPSGLSLGVDQVLNLFDVQLSSDDQDQSIRRFLRRYTGQRGTPCTDVLFYFIGHGTSDRDGRFIFLLRATEQDRLERSSYSARDLADAFAVEAPTQRRWLFLDCCASGKAFTDFQPSASVLHCLQNEANAIFPARGTAIFAACSADAVARVSRDQGCTIFTSALIDVLETKYPDYSRSLSLVEVATLTREEIYRRFQSNGVRPELSDPDQRKGTISQIPFFPNGTRDANTITAPSLSRRRMVIGAAGVSLGAVVTAPFVKQLWHPEPNQLPRAAPRATEQHPPPDIRPFPKDSAAASKNLRVAHSPPTAQEKPFAAANPTTGFAGFDCVAFPGLSQIGWIQRNTNLCWSGYYLAPTPGMHSSFWMGHRADLTRLGWGILPIYVGQQTIGPGSHKITQDQGKSDGDNAVQLMLQEGFPLGSYVYLDLEEGPPFTSARALYVSAWIDRVRSSHFQVGLYCSHTFAEDVHNYRPFARIWAYKVAMSAPHSVPGTNFPAPAPSKVGYNGTFIWQYEQQAKLGLAGVSDFSVDLNSAFTQNPGAA